MIDSGCPQPEYVYIPIYLNQTTYSKYSKEEANTLEILFVDNHSHPSVGGSRVSACHSLPSSLSRKICAYRWNQLKVGTNFDVLGFRVELRYIIQKKKKDFFKNT